MYRVLGSISCDIDPKVNIKDQIVHVIVNVSPQKPSHVATLNFAGA